MCVLPRRLPAIPLIKSALAVVLFTLHLLGDRIDHCLSSLINKVFVFLGINNDVEREGQLYINAHCVVLDNTLKGVAVH